MDDEKAQRFEEALSSLVEVLVPPVPGEDEDAADDRHEDALDRARDIIEKCAAIRLRPSKPPADFVSI